ncbi:MAG: hypothetical protein E7370_03225 [Clostridiales bacterium]|nr:hypothetical protein [Clostridiales bacterium]
MKIKKSLMTVLVASALLCSLTTACAPAHEHSWGDGEVTTQPTCTTEGVKTFTCECGETKTEAVAATGHSFGAEWEFDNDGHWHVCSVCDATSDKLDHTSATDCDDCDYEVVVPADPAFDLSAVAMEEREGNAYYVITGTYAAYTEDQITFDFQRMDGWSYINDLPVDITLADGEFEIAVNLASLGNEGNMLAHINLDGEVKDVEFAQGTDGVISSVTVNEKVYTVKYEYATTWSRWMPLVTVADAAVVEPGTYPEEAEMKYSVSGYEWGPAVDKIIVKFNGTVENVSVDDFSVSQLAETMDWSTSEYVETEVALNVVDAYPCSATGAEVEGASEYVAFALEAKYNVASPFVYANSLNNWVESMTFIVELNEGCSLSVTNGATATTYTSFDQTSVLGDDARVSPSTDNLNKGTHTANGFTLTYAAYETEAMADDGEANPLIIWLHGAGEGGTDVDIALLGNDVTNLMEEGIQSHFITDDIKGAYVLAVQTPTMWMDSGSGQHSGDQPSQYTETLMDTIETYVAENGDIDTDRIYIGGCSNGGYMTMNMLIQHGEYFAAAYPVCEAYMDSYITDEQIEALAEYNIWFTTSADDTTVNPQNFTNATYLRILEAGAENVYFSYFQNVRGTDNAGQSYMGHFSWIYVFLDQCTAVQSIDAAANSDLKGNNQGGGKNTVQIDGEDVTLWQWIAAQTKGNSVGEFVAGEEENNNNNNNNNNGGTVRLEAEEAEHYNPDGAANNITVETNEACSNGQGVGYFTTAGASITFTYTADAAVSGVTLKAGVASATTNDNSEINELSVDTFMSYASVTVNGNAVTFTGDPLPGNNAFNYWNVGEFTATIDLVAGENVIVITSNGTAVNVDYFELVIPESQNGGGNNDFDGEAVRFEAEEAELVSAEGGSNPIQIESNAACSNGQGVGYMQDAGNTINFNFTASAAATEVKLVICIAPATMTQTDNGSEIGELAPADLPSYCAITINGEAITFTGDPIPGNNAMNYWNVGTFTATINLAAGENVISFVSQGLAINVDYIDVYANVA